MDRGIWWATVHTVTKSRTRQKWLSMHACTHFLYMPKNASTSLMELPSGFTPMITPLDLSLNRPTHSCQLKQLMYLWRWPQSSWLGPWAYKWTIRAYEHLRLFHMVMLRFINFINIILYWKRYQNDFVHSVSFWIKVYFNLFLKYMILWFWLKPMI